MFNTPLLSIHKYSYTPTVYTVHEKSATINEYNVLTVVEDKYMMVDLNFEHRQALASKSTSLLAYNVLTGWRDTATPLVMRSRQSIFDDIYVVLNSILPIPLDRSPEQKNNLERYLVQLSFMDV